MILTQLISTNGFKLSSCFGFISSRSNLQFAVYHFKKVLEQCFGPVNSSTEYINLNRYTQQQKWFNSYQQTQPVMIAKWRAV